MSTEPTRRRPRPAPTPEPAEAPAPAPLSRPLYDLAAEVAVILREIEEAGGEITPELEEKLNASTANVRAKAENVCKAIRIYDAEAAKYSPEIERLAARQSTARNTAENLREYLKRCLVAANEDHLEVGTFNVAIRDSQPSVRWEGAPEAIPPIYRRTVPAKIELDKKAALAAFKSGEWSDDRLVVTRSKTLTIR